MKIIKILSEIGTMDIRIEESENKYLDIVFGGTGDIYWIFDNQEVAYLKEDPMYDTLIIPKTDYDIYKIFEELYNDLINGKIYYPEKIQSYYLNIDPEAQEKENKRCEDSNERIKNSSRYKKLVNNEVITWYSDEEYKDNAEIVRISKQMDYILREFIRQTKEDEQGQIRLPGWYSIRFRLDGSTYTPCDTVFWRHFNNLQQYEPIIHNEFNSENSFQKKLIPTKYTGKKKRGKND